MVGLVPADLASVVVYSPIVHQVRSSISPGYLAVVLPNSGSCSTESTLVAHPPHSWSGSRCKNRSAVAGGAFCSLTPQLLQCCCCLTPFFLLLTLLTILARLSALSQRPVHLKPRGRLACPPPSPSPPARTLFSNHQSVYKIPAWSVSCSLFLVFVLFQSSVEAVICGVVFIAIASLLACLYRS